MDPSQFDPARLAIDKNKFPIAAPVARRSRPPRPRSGEWFIKGPIPGEWIARAATVGGRALRVAIAIWCEAGMKRSRTVRLSAEMQRRFSICQGTCKRALAELQGAGLISVNQQSGRRPRITIEDAPAEFTSEGHIRRE